MSFLTTFFVMLTSLPGHVATVKPDDQTLDHHYLSVADLEKFRPGRSKRDVFNDLQWRAETVNAGICDGKSVMVFAYTLGVDPSDIYKSESFHAIFVDGKFEKFIRWDTGVADKPAKVGDCGRLARLMNSPPVSADELRKAAQSSIAPKKHVDYGLTAVFLVLRPVLKIRFATRNDDKKNTALRDQFNAARLDIGMTEPEVERVLKAKPIESEELDAGSCKVYGSNESFTVGEHHFTNIVVVFREGKAIVIFNFPAGELGRHFAPKGVIDYLKRQDAAVGQSDDKKNSRK